MLSMTPQSRQMVGRDAELGLLVDATHEARDGEIRLALVTGEAGIGKSRLVHELVRHLDDALVLECHGVEMGTGEIPFRMFGELLRDLERKDPTALTDDERAALGPLLPGARIGESAERVALLGAGVALLERVCADRVVCWVLEDLQWADAATKDLLSLVLRGASGCRLLVVATVRTEDLERSHEQTAEVASYVASLARLPLTTTIPLGRLTRAEVDRLLADLVERPLPPGVADRIAELTDGNPFVAEELVAARGRPELSTAAAVSAARVASLPEEARRLVGAAAVGAGHLRISLVEEVADLVPEALDRALREAIAAGVLTDGADRTTLVFRHALLRDAVDRALPATERRAWHRRWAEALERRPEGGDRALLASADHWFQAGDPRALPAALVAAPVARRLGEGELEPRLWRRALELWPQDHADVAGCTWRDCVAQWCRVRRTSPADLDYMRSLLARVDDPVVAIFLRHNIMRGPKAKGELWHLSDEEIAEAATALHAGPVDLLRASALMTTAMGHKVGDPRADRLVDEADALFADLGDIRGRVVVSAIRSFRLAVAGRVDIAADRLQAQLATSDLGSGFDLWALDGDLLYYLVITGRHAEVEAVFQRARGRVVDPRAAGVRWEHVIENVTASWTETGQWQRAIALITEGRPYWGEGVKHSDLRLARLHFLSTGSLPDLSTWIESLAAPDTPLGPMLLERAHLVAQHAGLAGDTELMRRAAGVIWDSADPKDSGVLWAAVRDVSRNEVDLAGPGSTEAERAAAASHLARITDVASGIIRFGPLGEVWPLELEALQAMFRGKECADALGETLAGWERIGHVHDAATCHLSLAQVLASQGKRQDALDHAEAAAEIARQLDAAPLRARADHLLERLGAHRSPAAGLTGRELEVLALVNEGRTNGQIAAALFISPKTASVHVSRIIAKLGASNRSEAAALGRARELI